MGLAQNYVGVSRRPPDVEDYIDMVRRYRSWIVAPMFAGLVVSVVVAFLQPDVFESYATLEIKPQVVPEKLVPNLLSSQQLSEKVVQMENNILSRTTLLEIINKPSLDLYKKERDKMPTEDVVNMMRLRDISIQPINTGGRFSAFRITFRYTDKYKASAVVRELVSKFTERNSRTFQDQVNMTNSFLKDERDKAKAEVDRLTTSITKFELDNQGKLPTQASSLQSSMMQVQMALMGINQSISRNNQDKMMLETNIANNRQQQNYVSANMETVIAGSAPQARVNEEMLNLSKQIQTLKSNLAAYKRFYGNNYPDIATLQAQIDSLEADQAELQKQELNRTAPAAGTSARTVVNPQMERELQDLKAEESRLKTQVTTRELEIQELNRQKSEFEKQLATYQKRLEDMPLNEQEYAQLQTDLQTAKAHFQEVIKREELSNTSQNLEEHKGGEQLEVLDPANVPDRAREPNRLQWAAIGTFGGLFCGLMLAAAKEVKNTSLKNLKDVRAYTNLPILSSIPLLENALLVRRKRRLVWLAWSSAVIVGVTLMGGSMYYYMSST